MSQTFRRRGMPVDLDIQEARGRAPRVGPNNAAADADYFGNLKKFHDRLDDTSAPPTRGAGSEKDQKPW